MTVGKAEAQRGPQLPPDQEGCEGESSGLALSVGMKPPSTHLFTQIGSMYIPRPEDSVW